MNLVPAAEKAISRARLVKEAPGCASYFVEMQTSCGLKLSNDVYDTPGERLPEISDREYEELNFIFLRGCDLFHVKRRRFFIVK